MTYSICAIIKDEQKFLAEWIKYHLSLGFTRIYLFEDFTSTSHQDITSESPEVQLKSMRDVPGCIPQETSRQCKVYNWLCKEKLGIQEWCLFIDIDEYLRLEPGVSLQNLTEPYQDTSGLQVWWKCYGASGLVESPEGSIQEAYGNDFKAHVTHGITSFDYKSFVNFQNSLSFYNCHYHRKIVNTYGDRADFRYNRNEKTWNLAWIDHYITKSWEDYIERLKRGNITRGIRNIDFFFKINPDMLPLKDELVKNLNLHEFPTI